MVAMQTYSVVIEPLEGISFSPNPYGPFLYEELPLLLPSP